MERLLDYVQWAVRAYSHMGSSPLPQEYYELEGHMRWAWIYISRHRWTWVAVVSGHLEMEEDCKRWVEVHTTMAPVRMLAECKLGPAYMGYKLLVLELLIRQ